MLSRLSSRRLELRTSSDESLTSLVAFVLLEVLDEALSQILGLSVPLRSVLVCITRIQDVLVHTLELCRNNEVEVRNGLRRSLVDLVIQDAVDDTTCIADRDTLASTVPASVDQLSLSTALLHVANELLSIL